MGCLLGLSFGLLCLVGTFAFPNSCPSIPPRDECQRLPRAMSMGVFREKIVGKGFTQLYLLEEETLHGNAPRIHVNTFIEKDVTDPNRFRERIVYRAPDDVSSGNCTETFNDFTKLSNPPSMSAVFEVVGTNYTLFYFSNRPDDYVVAIGCSELNPVRKCCKGGFFVSLSSSRNPPNGFPWKCADSDIKNQLKLVLDDDGFMFTRKALECANAVHEVNNHK